MDSKKLKAMIKTPAPKSTFGTDPKDPWSTKAEINETKMLDQYLSTKGVNPKYAPKNLKVAHSKTNAFKKWARDHYDAVKKKEALKGQTLQLQGEETEQLDELSKETLKSYQDKAVKTPPSKNGSWVNRIAGVARSAEKLKKEEVEQIDELAPKTLRSYIRKSYNEPGREAGYARANEKHGAALEKELASRKASGKTIHTLGSITRKLRGEEVEQIDEISKKTALSYLTKSGKEIKHGSETPHKRNMRIDGYFRAGDRLANLKKTSGPGISMGGPGKLSTEEKEADYGKNYQAMVQRVKAKAAQKPVDMTSLAARLQASYKKDDEKKSVKEDAEQLDELSKDTIKRYHSRSILRAVGRAADIYDREVEGGKKPDPEMHRKLDRANKNLARADARLKKEEIEQIDEWENTKTKALKDLHKGKDSGIEATGAEGWKQRKAQEMSKSARMVKALYKHHKVVKEESVDEGILDKVLAKGKDVLNRLDGNLDTNHAINQKRKEKLEKLKKQQRTVKEDMYDHEKGDKAPATYGKAPKHDKADPKDSQGENKPKAAAVLTGGTTLTGQKRDDVEIDPMMRARPGQPDPTKKKDGDKDKDDKKKDK